MKKQQRTKKGAVSIGDKKGMLRLRWSYQSKSYEVSPGLSNTPVNMQAAQALALQIERDIAFQELDMTLEKYRPKKAVNPVAPLDSVQLWEKFIDHRRNTGTSEQALISRYHPVMGNLKRYGKMISSHHEALEFISLLRSRQSARIVNQNLSLLQGFGRWCIKQGHWELNHFETIEPLKASRPKGDKPFTLSEIQKMEEAAQSDPVLLHYRDFIIFLLHSGCRPSEAIALRWENVDFTNGEFHIVESLSRGVDGERIRKGTKTEQGERTLAMSPAIRSMLEARKGSKSGGFVFLSPKGKPIDDHNFSQRTWRRLCEQAGIPYRRPYNCRHSVASHAIKQGATLTEVAYLLGHTNTRMVATTYGKIIDRPSLPDLRIP